MDKEQIFKEINELYGKMRDTHKRINDDQENIEVAAAVRDWNMVKAFEERLATNKALLASQQALLDSYNKLVWGDEE